MATTLKGEGITRAELRAAMALAGLFVLRMLGLFMILPVFALYAEHLAGATPLLIGLAIGIYGLTQACLQIPFGMLSDRWGRKRVILLGLVLFALGSVVAALSDTIGGVILGRALQGAGAIAAAVMALAADLTREEHRIKVMAIIGASIGLSFALAMVLGPLLDSWIGVPGIFWFTAALALGGMALVRFVIPNPAISRLHRDTSPVPELFKRVLGDEQLLRLDFGIFALHLLLTATFVVMPVALRDFAGLPAAQHWQFYLPVLVLSFLAMVPFIVVAEKRRRLKPIFLGAILLLGVTELLLSGFHDNVWTLALLVFAFFTAFNFLEASLPSLIAKMSPPDAKGTAMGIYSSSQFLGAFLGGALGGASYGAFGIQGPFVVAGLLALVWLAVAFTMKNPRYLSSYLLNVGQLDEEEARQLARRLTEVQGVAEAVVIGADGIAYLKVDRHALDEPTLLRFAAVEGP
ncbi:MAG: MFS transporter [Candidatus Competibacteraceae bacterium]|nr:MFS transporter [Candidatus Competibacteraceae bacterium]